MSVANNEHLIRLRVNRVAIIQTLQVDDILDQLLEKQVLRSGDYELIQKAATPHDQARIFIDILPSSDKKNTWYTHFRDALKKPDTNNTDIRKKYSILVEFLDNTIIPKPPGFSKLPASSGNTEKPKREISKNASQADQLQFPRYDTLPGISNPESANQSHTSINASVIVENGFGNQESSTDLQYRSSTYVLDQNENEIDENSLLLPPSEYFEELKSAKESNESGLFEKEQAALSKMQLLEKIYNRFLNNELQEEFCTTQAVQEFLADHSLFPFYHKYMKHLKERHNLDLLSDVLNSYCRYLEKLESAEDENERNIVVKVGLGLFEYTYENGFYYKSESAMQSLILYLLTSPGLETWMVLYKVLVKLMAIRVTNVQFTDADVVYHAALEIGRKIGLVSFGQDFLDESGLFVELSRLLHEQGSVGPAFDWSRQALKEVKMDNLEGIISVLINASQTYPSKLQHGRAQQLAVQAVLQARDTYGIHSPVFVKALINYCQFSSLFSPDETAFKAAETAAELAEKLYQGPSLLVAESRMVLASVLLSMCEYGNLGNDQLIQMAADAQKHAIHALRTAQDLIPGSHPKLAVYRNVLARCLETMAVCEKDESNQRGLLIWAEAETLCAYQVTATSWGDNSLHKQHSALLLAALYAKLDKIEDSTKLLDEVEMFSRISLAPYSYNWCKIKYDIAGVLLAMGQPQQACQILVDLLEHTENTGFYIPWVQQAFDTVIYILQAQGKTADVEKFLTKSKEWQEKNPRKQQISWEQLAEEKPKSYEEFLQGFDISNKLRGALKITKPTQGY